MPQLDPSWRYVGSIPGAYIEDWAKIGREMYRQFENRIWYDKSNPIRAERNPFWDLFEEEWNAD